MFNLSIDGTNWSASLPIAVSARARFFNFEPENKLGIFASKQHSTATEMACASVFITILRNINQSIHVPLFQSQTAKLKVRQLE